MLTHINKFIFSFLALSVLMVAPGCENNFEEMNVDPFNPTETSVNFLFNDVIASMRYVRNEKLYLNGQRMYQWSQLGAATFDEPNELNDLGRDPVWNDLYGPMRNIREIETRLDAYTGDQERMRNRRALIKILMAYKALRTTDLYGDIPYSEAGRGVEEGNQIFRPKYDVQSSIYTSALADLKSAADALILDPGATTPAGESYFNYGSNETLFNNDMLRWKKFANALRLRYALRMSNVDESAARGIISEVLDGGQPLPEGHEDMIAFSPEINNVGADIYWAFQFFFGVRMGENAWNHMTDDPNPDGSGIIDPRVYVYFEPNIDNMWVPAPQSPAAQNASDRGGEPYNDTRRNDPNGFDLRGTYSGFNWYLVENDEMGVEFHVGYPEVCFLRAEAYQRGFANGSAQEWYEKGITASVEKWYTFGTTNPDWTEPPMMPTEEEMTAFLTHPKIQFDEGEGLKQIHTQRWLDLMLQPQEAWHLFRRSGLIPEIEVVNAITNGTEPTPRRLRYPEDERNNNLDNYNQQVATMQGGDEISTRMWWDVN